MTANRSRPIFLIAATIVPAGILGCPQLEPATESVLAGTWEVIPSNPPPQLTKSLVTFNSRGDIARVKFTLTDQTTITWNSFSSGTSIHGDQIHISATTGGNNLSFDGTLNSGIEPTIADGEFTVSVTFEDVSISERAGEAILVKQ